MLANHDLDVDADLAGPAENFHDPPHRRKTALRKSRHFYIHYGAVELRQPSSAIHGHLRTSTRWCAEFFAQFRRQLFARRNRDFVENPRVIREDDVAVRAVAKKSHKRGVRALEDLNHAPFRAAVSTPTFDAGEDVIAVHGIAQIIAADKKIAFHPGHRRIRHHETVSIAMRYDSSGNQIGIGRALRSSGDTRASGCGRGCRFCDGCVCFTLGRGTRRAWRILLRVLRSGQAISSAVNFLDSAFVYELLNNSR